MSWRIHGHALRRRLDTPRNVFYVRPGQRKFSVSLPSGSITDASIKPIDLEYTEVIPSDGNKTKGALVLVHGLLGFKRNFNSLAKAFSRDLNKPVYALDVRNHGNSPHAMPMDYPHMAADVLHFIQKHKLTEISLLGHSMGGKIVMTLALNRSLPPSILSNLIVADIAPTKGRVSKASVAYVEAMKRIERMKLRTRKEADDVLSEVEKDPSIRGFVLSNLITPSDESEYARFCLPLDIVREAIPEIGSFPYEPGEAKYEGRTLFIKGGKSKFINESNIPIAKTFFPNMQVETLDAGHWVHAERPNEFKKLVVDFIRSGSA